MCDGGSVGRAAVCGVDDGSGVVRGRLQRLESCEFGVGVCEIGPESHVIVCGIGVDGRAAPGQFQRPGSREHGLSVCDSGWAFATTVQRDAPSYVALSRAAKRSAGDGGGRAWAFAMPVQSDMQLFTEVAKAAERRLSDFQAQELADKVWAFTRKPKWSADRKRESGG